MTVFATPAALRLAYYGTGDGIHTMYPSDLISRIPDNADWLPNITGIGGQGQIQGFVGPIITTPGVTANGGEGYAYDANRNMLFWDANGHLVTQNDLPASSGAARQAATMADAYNPAGPHFGENFTAADGGTGSFEPTQAVSVAGRMANLGEDFATASARASAAATKLGVKVIPVPPPTMTAPVVPSAATPPGLKLPVNPPMPTLPLNADRPPAAPTQTFLAAALPGESTTPTKAVTAPPATAPTGNAFVDAIQAHAGAIAAAIVAILLLLSGRGGE